MQSFFTQLKWQLRIYHRNNLINISIAMTAIYIGIFFLIRDMGNLEKILTLFIYNDPAIIGLFFTGLGVIIEKNQGVLYALFTSPVSIHTYLLSKAILLTLVGWLCSIGMVLAAVGPGISWFVFSAGVLTTCFIFSLVGIFVVSFTTQFLHYLIRSIPIFLVFSLPLLDYFGLLKSEVFHFSPLFGSLQMISNSFESTIELKEVIFHLVSSLVWIIILYYCVYHVFKTRIKYLLT